MMPSLLPVSNYTDVYNRLLHEEICNVLKGYKTWVSVGFDRAFEDKLARIYGTDMLCVNPLLIDPLTDTIEDLVSERPEIVGDAGCLLIHPCFSCRYDMDVIEQLKPPVIVLFFCENRGITGSDELHEWLEREHEGYTKLHWSGVSNGIASITYRAAVLARKDRRLECNDILSIPL